LIKEVDLLYHEATFEENELLRAKSTLHSTASQAATIASLANVKQLVIGHFSARYSNHKILLKEAKQVFENTVLATDMTEMPINA
jgi:ribonuclease Z